jgi:L-lactate dehydrogenase complex protein LldG
MSSRDKIFSAIRKNKPESVPYTEPDLNLVISYPDLLVQFSTVLTAIGGSCKEVASLSAAKEFIASLDKGAWVIDTTSNYPADLASLSPDQLAAVDTAIIQGGVAVAENGSIWVTEENMVNRLLPFIAQQLILLIHEKDLVPTMHHAYEKINVADTGFGAFIAGPSKTADIEQSLVIGAHGPCGMMAVVVREE